MSYKCPNDLVYLQLTVMMIVVRSIWFSEFVLGVLIGLGQLSVFTMTFLSTEKYSVRSNRYSTAGVRFYPSHFGTAKST